MATMRPMRTTVPQILQMARKHERIAMLTAYDYPTARLLDESGIPILLVGDSLGRVMLAPVPRTLPDRYAPRFRERARNLHEQFWSERPGPAELA